MPRTASSKSKRELGLQVRAALRAATPLLPRPRRPRPKRFAEQIADVVGADVEREAARAGRAPAEAAGAEPTGAVAAHRTEPADLVVLLAPRLVTEHVVRGRDLLEALFGGGVDWLASGWCVRASFR